MSTSAIGCDFRNTLPGGSAHCLRITEITGIEDPAVTEVQPDACFACTRSLRWKEPVNPVVASVAYNALDRIEREGGHPECDLERAIWLKRCVSGHVPLILDRLPDRMFPPEGPRRSNHENKNGEDHSRKTDLTWAVAMMTAPREVPTLERAIESVNEGGFSEMRIFAEPGSELPSERRGLSITRRRSRLGTMVNFYAALAQLWEEFPEATCFAVFQDDIQVARGLREWCESEFWPCDAGIVSLFTPRLHAGQEKGWQFLTPGYQRVCGAQALVLRRDIVEKFLSDAAVLHRLTARRHNNDAVLAAWAAREGYSIAYHTPSLVGHIGYVSSLYSIGPDRRNAADPVASVADISRWKKQQSGGAAIGLIGWNTPTGVGYQNRNLFSNLPISKWLVPRHGRVENLPLPESDSAQVDLVEGKMSDEEIREWCEGLDWLLFSERPYLKNLVRVAAQSGVGIACMPNWEWVQPDLRWLPFVDVMFCPTKFTHLLMSDWKERFGFGWETVYFPWPVDSNRFPFRERTECRRFLFVNGWGGSEISYPDGSPVKYRRKGWEVILEAARLAPDLNFAVFSQRHLKDDLPDNIELLESPENNADLYAVGDVCVQPSHFEGLGLQLLECQAAGMPLVTTDGGPMNEFNPWKVVPASGMEVINVGPGPIHSYLLDAEDLVAVLRDSVGKDICEVSHQARDYVVNNHSWDRAGEILDGHLLKR